MRVLIAARLSKKVGPGQTGIESQDLRMREWVRSIGHEPIEVVADHVSGRKAPWARPNLRAWVTNPGHMVQYDAIAAYALDRLTRGNDAETAEIEAWARDNGKQLLVFSGDLRYPAEGSAGIAWDVAKRIAHQEWLSTSERTHRGLSYLRDNNFLTGSLPWGFMAVESGGHKTMIPDPGLAPVIREISDRYMSGETTRELCAWLRGQGITSKTGGPWVPRSLSRFLKNPVLRGRYTDGKGRTIMRVPAILTDTEHRALIAEMGQRVKPGNPRRKERDMLLGVLLCRKCQGIMRARRIVAVRADGSQRVNWYYRCDGSAMNPSVCRNMIRRDRIEAAVDRWFTTEAFSAREYTERTVIPGDSHQDELNVNAADMAELIAGQDDIPAGEFVARLTELRAERDEIRGRPVAPPQVAETGTGITIRQYWRGLDAAGKRRYLIDAGVRVYAASGAQSYMTYDDVRVAESAMTI